ncbi:hypothetical protein K443DRAFT_673381 [Laccaria amethystina LaAM-08-1]|uniref:Uncharacterized protein n=1 Tax=Laccaria amethystina LaAM-08-1 TaxID=1095629 RepID=A0A0C9YB57_9AGAR|nr:hypothetical protein K443DRAFT_673381 [Laccaria amethystina LaAM-08-1]
MNFYSASAALPVTSSNLKRSRSGANGSSGSFVPAAALPKIHSSDLVLRVFTHKSLRRATHSSTNLNDFDDNERLAELGKAALDVAVAHVLFNKRPMLKPSEMSSQQKHILSDENINNWVTFYNLRMKLRCHPNLYPRLNTPQETCSIFYAYVGGIYAESGQEAVREWIDLLVQGTTIETEQEPPEPAPPFREETPPQKRMKSEPLSPSTESSIFFASQPPSALRHLPPHMEQLRPPPQSSQLQALTSSHFRTLQQVQPPPNARISQFQPRTPPPSHFQTRPQQTQPQPNPLAPAQPNLPFLPLFNQTASQRRVTVEYPAEFSGPSHAGRWTVQCVVNGILKGVGTGGSKQVAKEEAARQAYYAMGWT